MDMAALSVNVDMLGRQQGRTVKVEGAQHGCSAQLLWRCKHAHQQQRPQELLVQGLADTIPAVSSSAQLKLYCKQLQLPRLSRVRLAGCLHTAGSKVPCAEASPAAGLQTWEGVKTTMHSSMWGLQAATGGFATAGCVDQEQSGRPHTVLSACKGAPLEELAGRHAVVALVSGGRGLKVQHRVQQRHHGGPVCQGQLPAHSPLTPLCSFRSELCGQL